MKKRMSSKRMDDSGGPAWRVRRRFAMLVVISCIALAVPLAVAACGGGEDEKETIVFSDLNWPSAEIQTRVVAYIVEHGYGYPTELVSGDTVSLWAALVNNDTQVTMEIWPAQQEWLQDVDEGTLVDVGQSLDTGWEAWVIPQYVKDANPGLVSVTDLPEYAHLFVTLDSNERARFVTCVPGWACEQVNAAKVTAYGLEDHLHVLNPGSGAGLFADLEASYARGEPWLGYLWFPTPPAVRLDLYVLEEPAYSDECWASDKACAYPEAIVKIMVNASLPPRAPDVVEFLGKWTFRAADQIEAELWMEENNETPEAGAIWFLRNYRDAWASLVPDGVAERVDEALEDEQ